MKQVSKPLSRTLFFCGLAALLIGCAADRHHREGMTLLTDGKTEEGLHSLELAVQSEPRNPQFRSDLLKKREEQFVKLLAQADQARAGGNFQVAETLYLRAANIPGGERAREGLEALARDRRYQPILEQAAADLKKGEFEQSAAQVRAVLADNPGNAAASALKHQIDDRRVREQAGQLPVPQSLKKMVNLEFRDASLRLVTDALTRASGINFVLDKEIRLDLRTTVILRQATVDDALEVILQTNRLEKKFINPTTVVLYPATPEKLKEYQDLMVKGFYLANADVKQTQVMLKSMLKVKDIFVDEKLNLLVMRDTPEAIRLAEKLIAMQDLYEPEVMLEVEVLEVKRSRLTELGVQLPSQITLTPLVPGNVATLSNLKDINSGSIGVTLPTATINLRRQIGDVKILANPRIRARNREKAKIMIGDKIPVVTITTTPTGVSSENVQYLDVGIKLDVEANVYLQDEVAIKVGLEVSSLVRELRTPAGSLAYQIGSRSASTVLRLKDGETQILAGLINDEDRKTASRVPGLGEIPLLGRLFSSQKDEREKTEIVLSITPRLIRNINRPDAANTEFWTGTDLTLRTKSGNFAAVHDIAEQGSTSPAPSVSQQGNLAPSTIVLSLHGPNQIKVGEEFKVAVRMKADGGVRSLPMQLAFDKTALQIVQIGEGNFFKQNDAQTSISSNIDLGAGRAYLSVIRSGVDGASGEGDVVVLTMRALTAKASDVQVLMAAPVSVGERQIVPAFPVPLNISISN